MTRKIIGALPLALLFVLQAYAQELNTPKLDSLFQSLEANDKFMGSVTLSQKGQIIYSKAIGYADVETGIKSNTQSKYRIGSISKMFTAALVFKGVEEQKLTLSQSIDRFFPSVVNAQQITIADLLNHRSGIFNLTSNADYLSWNTTPKSEEELVAIIAKGKSQFEPNSRAEYSNSNYVLLSFLLEKVYEKPYGDLLNEKIIRPLGLKDTYLGKEINLDEKEVNSYKYVGSWSKESETDMSIPLGAGAVVSNPSDLTRFVEALFQGRVISEESLAQMTTIKDGFGMGIFQIPFFDKKGFGHTGGIDGFTSMLTYIPEDKLAVALTSNGTNYSNNNIMIAALSSFYNKPFDVPVFSHVTLSEEELEPFLGIYGSEQIPLKITISREGNTLMAQVSGQSAFALEASTKHIFKFDQAGLVLEFKPDEKQLLLKQGGGEYLFVKE